MRRRVRGDGPLRRVLCQQVRLQQHAAVRPKPPRVLAECKHSLHRGVHLRLLIVRARPAQHARRISRHIIRHQTPSSSRKLPMRCSASVRCAME